jgi:hypothetical protein
MCSSGSWTGMGKIRTSFTASPGGMCMTATGLLTVCRSCSPWARREQPAVHHRSQRTRTPVDQRFDRYTRAKRLVCQRPDRLRSGRSLPARGLHHEFEWGRLTRLTSGMNAQGVSFHRTGNGSPLPAIQTSPAGIKARVRSSSCAQTARMCGSSRTTVIAITSLAGEIENHKKPMRRSFRSAFLFWMVVSTFHKCYYECGG